jgi:Tfp pilus assembly protein PilX
MKRFSKQSGAVSLFVVIFATLLITVITVSFISIMIQNQQQATANDLSQNAYDSAQAGVEDAKRAILYLQSYCASHLTSDCNTMKSTIDSQSCNTAVEQLADVKNNVSGGEVIVQTSSGDSKMNQAYTCVKISMDTGDYVGVLGKDSSQIIPLVGVSNYDTIKIEWFNQSDLQGSSTGLNLLTPGDTSLLSQGDWVSANNPNQPSIMRAQLIEYNNSSFNISDFDNDSSNGNASNNTLFLYPSDGVNSVSGFTDNIHPTSNSIGGPGMPSQVPCSSSNLSLGGYACSATLTLPKPVNSNDHTAYLNLESLYRKSSFSIMLLNGGVNGTPVSFDGVQPLIDSTGRANDLFRRVQSRVELTNVNFPYPQGEIDITGNLCKTFFVTDSTTSYSPGSCSP